MTRISTYCMAALAFVAMATASCSKDKNDAAKPAASDTIYNKLLTVKNFAGDTTVAAADRTTFYFSLEQQKVATAADLQTTRWDISFTGTVHTAIGGNYGADTSAAASFGKGGPGKGGVLILTKAFDDVTKVPDDAVFSTRQSAFGLDDGGSFGAGIGWAVYDFAGNLRATLGFGGNGPTQAHTCWARPDRTIIVRTANGNYVKIKMISLYKDAPAEPVTRDASSYFTFQYVIAKPGTKDFTIK